MNNQVLLNTAVAADESKVLRRLLIIVVCLTNFSQMPFFVEFGITRYLSFPAWIALFAFVVLFRPFLLGTKQFIFILAFVFVFVLQLIAGLFTGYNYLSSTLSFGFYLSAFIFLTAALCAPHMKREDLHPVLLAYALTALVVAVDIHSAYLGSGTLEARTYAYTSKNSVSQIILSAVIILMVLKLNSKIGNVFRVLCVPYLVYVLFVLRSRASLVGFFLVVIILLFAKKTHPALRWCIGLSALAFIVLLVVSPGFSQTVFTNILFANRDPTDLDSLSSGRVTLFRQFPSLMEGNQLFGVGNLYYDCFFLAAILNNGIFGGVAMILTALYPLVWSLRRCMTEREEEMILLLVVCAYTLNAVFECVAPFGPGVKCYLLWLLFGFISARRAADEEKSVPAAEIEEITSVSDGI